MPQCETSYKHIFSVNSTVQAHFLYVAIIHNVHFSFKNCKTKVKTRVTTYFPWHFVVFAGNNYFLLNS